MKMIKLFIAILVGIFTVSLDALANRLQVESMPVYMTVITHFDFHDAVDGLGFSVNGSMYDQGAAEGGLSANDAFTTWFKLDNSCHDFSNQPCGLGTIILTIDNHETKICQYVYSYYSHTGRFLLNKPFKVAGTNKFLSCHAVVTSTSHFYVFITEKS